MTCNNDLQLQPLPAAAAVATAAPRDVFETKGEGQPHVLLLLPHPVNTNKF